MSSKIELTQYEIMTMIGAVNPCMSDRLKAALDVEIAKPDYQGLALSNATILAIRRLTVNSPKSFDLSNRDDVAAQRLSSVLVNDDGSIASPEEVAKRVVPMKGGGKKATSKKERPKPFPSSKKLSDKEIDAGLRVLKNEILDATVFQELVDFFLDEYGENSRFLEHGKIASKASGLVEALKLAAGRVFPNEPTKVSNLMLTKLSKHHFIHGYVQVNNRSTIFFAFEDMGMGIAAIAEESGETHYMRITICKADDKGK